MENEWKNIIALYKKTRSNKAVFLTSTRVTLPAGSLRSLAGSAPRAAVDELTRSVMKINSLLPVAFVAFGIFLLVILTVGISFFTERVASLEFDQIFNLFEALLWIGISLAFLVRRRNQKNYRGLSLVIAWTFFAFGISDLIEVQTRTWYQPVGLLLLKSVCVLVLLLCFVIYLKRSK